MAMAKMEVTIRGISPLLMHRFPLVPTEGMDKKPVADQAEEAAYRDPLTRRLFVPGVCVQRALVNAAVFSKGKGRASLQKTAAACLLVSPDRLDLNQTTYEIDSRAVVVPATKGRVVRHRPRIDPWELSFSLEYDDVLLKETEVRKIVDDAGLRVGLLDFRPECKGPFGRFTVTVWKSDDED